MAKAPGAQLGDTDGTWWRASFSNLERKISKPLDQEGNSRKLCLRVVKFLLLDNGPPGLVSYHLKTAWLHFVSQGRPDADASTNLRQQVQDLLASLRDVAHKRTLEHFFVPGDNLLADLSPSQLHDIEVFIEKRLQYCAQLP